jgi:diacylglycerol kinase family enzyme
VSVVRGLVVLNRGSGRHRTSAEELRRLFPEHRVVACNPSDVADTVRLALAEEVGFVGVAGGDGSIRGGAEHLVETDVPLLPVPAGTRNHFAHQLGISDLEAAVQAADGMIETVDVGEVNGRLFINNSAIGLYPEMVRRRERYQRRGIPKTLAHLAAAWHQARHGHRFDVAVDGEPCRAWLVFVGNGEYGDDIFDIADRRSISRQVLDVRVVRADRFLARTRVSIALVLGRLHRSPLLVQRLCSQVALDLAVSDVEVALDGEIEVLASPLRYRSRPRSLRVLVPAHAPHHGPLILGHHHHHDDHDDLR